MKRYSCFVFVLMCMTSCAVTYMDLPSAFEENFWNKPGYKRNDVAQFLWQVCKYKKLDDLAKERLGVDIQTLDKELDAIVFRAEECMLENGFTYEDKPKGFIESKNGGRCRFSFLQYLPSCQILMNSQK